MKIKNNINIKIENNINSKNNIEIKNKINEYIILNSKNNIEIKLVGDTYDDCAAAAKQYTAEHDMTFISAFDDYKIIEGQGTFICFERRSGQNNAFSLPPTITQSNILTTLASCLIYPRRVIKASPDGNHPGWEVRFNFRLRKAKSVILVTVGEPGGSKCKAFFRTSVGLLRMRVTK